MTYQEKLKIALDKYPELASCVVISEATLDDIIEKEGLDGQVELS